MSLGWLGPRVVAAFFALELALRLTPFGWYAFRPWEELAHGRSIDGPFRPHAMSFKEKAYGDLASIGNLPAHRQHRAEQFSIDAHGYRRNGPAGAAAKPYAYMMIGDSFAVGGGATADDKTVPAQLERILNQGVYNAGNVATGMEPVLRLARAVDMKQGTILFETIDRYPPLGADALLPKVKKRTRTGEKFKRLRRTIRTTFIESYVQVSPLRILLQKGFKRINNGVIFPNPGRAHVSVEELRDGSPMLFLNDEMASFASERPDPDVSGWLLYAREMKAHGFDVVFVLAPEKYGVYRELLKTPPPAVPEETMYINRIEKAARAANLRVINLYPALKTAAAKAFREGRLLYWRDDTHWNDEGMKIAAEFIAQHIH